MPSEKRKFGDIGESIFVKHAVKHGFAILDRNYLKKWGEIDVVAEKGGILHFIEVKSVSRETSSGEYPMFINYDPEENVHPWKLKRLSRAIQTYLIEKDIDEDKEWQVDIAAVFIDFKAKKAKIRITEDIGL